MNIVVAIDSLKGSLTSMEAGISIKEGILNALDANITVMPLADGGEGTTDALIEGLGGEKVTVTVTNPIGKPIQAYYGYLKENNTAIIEIASSAGITLITSEQKDPMTATTFGVGEMIKDAISKGCRNFIIGLGGSVTNDGGVGMLQALGYEFYDESGKEVGHGGQALAKIKSISDQNRLSELSDCTFRAACDVNNPLCGMEGATYIYGPQKGVTEELKPLLDSDMKHYADITKEFISVDHSLVPGAGAAGGLGFAFLSYLNATLESGVGLILDAIKLEEHIKNADYVITGEGRLDSQSAMGKAPIGVAELAKKHKAKVIALAGSVADDAGACNQKGIDAYFSILNSVVTLEQAMEKETASKNLRTTAEQIFRLIHTIQ